MNGGKILYVRYVDNFILLFDTAVSIAKKFNIKLKCFLEKNMGLKLNKGNEECLSPSVKDGRKGFKFLGFFFKPSRNYALSSLAAGVNKKGQNQTGYEIHIDIPNIFKHLSYLGFCTREGFPIEHGGLMNSRQKETNLNIIWLISEYLLWVSLARNRKRAMSAVKYVLMFSLAKTYAAKFRLKTIRKTLGISGKEFNRPIKADMRGTKNQIMPTVT